MLNNDIIKLLFIIICTIAISSFRDAIEAVVKLDYSKATIYCIVGFSLTIIAAYYFSFTLLVEFK